MERFRADSTEPIVVGLTHLSLPTALVTTLRFSCDPAVAITVMIGFKTGIGDQGSIYLPILLHVGVI